MSKMPMIFAGHGSPMNAIEDNRYTREWREMGINCINLGSLVYGRYKDYE